MDVVGIDISKAKFDVALLTAEHSRHATFSNTEAGFERFLTWLTKHRSDPDAPLHACMEATGNWGLELADALHSRGVRVSVVNPARIKAFGESELARNKTDKLDAALIARFCRAHVPPAWTPPLPSLRELRELVRRCDALKSLPPDLIRGPLASRNSTARRRALPHPRLQPPSPRTWSGWTSRSRPSRPRCVSLLPLTQH